MDLRTVGGRHGPAATPDAHRWLLAADGVRVSAAYDRGPRPDPSQDVCFVLAHGFTQTWSRPDGRRVSEALARHGAVVSFDMRGHGRSSGVSTVGDEEVLDLDAAIAWARWLGHGEVVTVGFSMGGSVVLRQAALAHPGSREAPDAVVSVSAAGFWFYRGTAPMRLLHRAVETRVGRRVLRHGYGTHVTPVPWQEPYPLSPSESAALLGHTPLLVVHGTADHYFPVEHAEAITASARERDVPVELWVEPGFAHAESSVSADLLDRIAAWSLAAVAASGPGADLRTRR